MIVCIGSINVDFIFTTARWPDEHEKYRAESYVCAGGGSAANTAVELSRLGRQVTTVGGIGTVDLGNIALRSLITAGVNIENIVRRSDWKTGCAAICSQGNSKSILTAGGIVDPTVVFESLQTIGVQRGDHLHFGWAPSGDTRLGFQEQGIDVAMARFWYERAAQLGSAEAPGRLQQLATKMPLH